MRRTAVIDEGGAERAGAGTFDVTRSAGGGGGPQARFRRVLHVALPVPDGATPTVTGAELRGAFVPLEHDALHPPPGVPAATVGQVSSPSLATVALPGPRELLSVTVVASKAGPGSGVDLHRLDGSTPSADPTVSGWSGGPLPPGFVDVRFGVQVRAGDDVVATGAADLSAVGVRTIPTGPTLGVAPAGAEPPVPVVGFWRGSTPDATGARPPLAQPHAHAVVRTGAALTIRDGDRARFELGLAPADVDVPFDVGDDLAAALRPLQEAAATPAEFALVLEADQPCVVRIDALSVSYRAVIGAFDGGPAQDRTLTFDGGRLREQVLTVTLPVGAKVTSATVGVRASLRADRSAPTGLGEFAAPVAGEPGVEVVPGRTVSGPLALPASDPPRATVVTGVVVPALPLEDGTSLRVGIQDDRGGAPSGADLAAAAVSLGPAGQPGSFVGAFASALTLPSSRHWVVVRATRGRAVWLADRAASEDAVSLAAPDGGPPAVVPGVRPRATALTDGTEDGSSATALTVSVGSVAVAAPTTGTSYDLTDAVTTVGAGPVRIRFASASKGTVTVAPPRVEFDLG